MTTSISSTDDTLRSELFAGLRAARRAAPALARLESDRSARILLDLADRIPPAADAILEANQADLARMDPADPKYDRLMLNRERLTAIADDLRNVALLASPLGEVFEARTLENGLELTRIRVPMGVVAVIFESRPNVTFDVFALCFRSGNACVLKGSSDARDSNRVIVALIRETLMAHGIDPAVVFLAPPQRAVLPHLLGAVGMIDLAIPRGSRGLIDFVRENARIPVIETGAGIVHTYVDASADLDMARAVLTNAKSRRVSVCNALDTVVLHEALLPDLPGLLRDLGTEYLAEVFADAPAFDALQGRYAGPLHLATEAHFGQEFLSMRLSVKTVAGLDEALEHIAAHSSQHSEAVLAEDPIVVERFLDEVDAAAVYANTSTAWTDGAQFGLGAEIGISTQKLHARGPMALPELTSYKWVVRGAGQVRP